MSDRPIQQLKSLREKDKFPSESLKEEMINLFSPKSTLNLVQDLSNVTSAFYGILLKVIGEKANKEMVDDISKELFYELGKLKSQQALEIMTDLPRDTRAFPIVLLSAIYNASPEYSFDIVSFTPELSIIELGGIDRYHRIAKTLDLLDLITWPTLEPFTRGIKDFLNIDCSINIDLKLMDDQSNTYCIYTFSK